MQECKRLGKIEANIEIVNALVAAGLLGDGDASQWGLDQALQRMAESWARAVS